MKTPLRFRLWALALLATAVTDHLALAQGTLTPPGAPAPTMKSLDQIDTHVDTAAAAKRIPINAVTTPGNAASTYVITQPGSYYLTGNLNGELGKDGIDINADNVTVDLNGFAVIGALISNYGIYSINDNVALRNGTVRSWGLDGVRLQGANQIFEGLRLSDNVEYGLIANGNSVIKDCAAYNNVIGLYLTTATITHCVATANQTGFFVNRCVVEGCVASANTGDGFGVTNTCLLSGNSALQNGGNGFRVSGTGLNRIDGNTAVGNSSAGIRWVNDLVIRNSCYSNSAGNYIPSSGGAMGPIQAASTATNPFANF
jgi:parallel beta-helix repeat protein